MTRKSWTVTGARSLWAGVLACAVGLSVTASAALADVDTAVPGGIGVVTTQAKSQALAGSGAQTNGFTYKIRSCDKPFVPVASAPSGYVIGNCAQGTHFYPQDTSTVDQVLYYGGFIFGNYGACGWIIAPPTSATQTDGDARCPAGSIGYNLNEFAMATNASAASAPGNDCNQISGKCTDGSTTSMKLGLSALRQLQALGAGAAAD
jgi:hypothetical protein